MKKKNIGFGLFLLLAGLVWVLINAGVIDWSIMNCLNILWPLIFVVVGINIIFKDNTVKVISWVLFAAVIIGCGYVKRDEPSEKGITVQDSVIIEKSGENTHAELKLELAALKMDVSSGTDELVAAEMNLPDVVHTYDNSGSNAYVSFEKKKYSTRCTGKKYFGNFKLNDSIIWDMELKTAATDLDMDLRELKVRKLVIQGAAGDIDLKFGANYPGTEVTVEGAAMSLGISLPPKAGIRLKGSSVLSEVETGDNWIKKDGYRQTANYETAEYKIDLNTETVVSSVRIDN